MSKYNHANFFVASEPEIYQIKSWQDIFQLIDKYEVCASYGSFDMVFALSRVFFQDERHIPKKVKIDASNISFLYKYDREFVEKIGQMDREEINKLAYILREDAFCQKNKMVGMGLWNLMYELNNGCKVALEKKLNLCLIEENLNEEEFEEILGK